MAVCEIYSLAKQPIPHFLRHWYIEQQNLKIFLDYMPKPYSGEIILFRCDIEQDGVSKDPLLGWSGIAEGPFKITNIPGRHESFIEEEEVGLQLASQLKAAQQRKGEAGKAGSGEGRRQGRWEAEKLGG